MDSVSAVTQPRAARLSPLVALQHRDFRLLWIGELVSQAGTQMQTVAINWHIYVLTGSALALGLTGLARVIPLVLFSLMGGMLADSRNRRRVLLFTQSTMMIFAAILGLVTNLELVSVWVIYLLAGLTAAANALDNPARKALTPNLVPKEHLTNALSLNNVMNRTAQILGPTLAGFAIAWWGVAAVYWINAISFLALLGALIIMRPPPQAHLGQVAMNLGALWDGIRFVRRSEIIFSTMLLDFFATVFASATALLPIFAQDILRVGPEGLGVLYAATSLGAIAAGVGMSFFGNIQRKGIVLLVSVAIYGAATVVFGVSADFWLTFVCLMAIGAGDTVSTILRNTIRQLATPDQLRGRMTGVLAIFTNGGPQVGNLEAGLVAAWAGTPFSVVSGGVATVLMVGAFAWLVPWLRHYRD